MLSMMSLRDLVAVTGPSGVRMDTEGGGEVGATVVVSLETDVGTVGVGTALGVRLGVVVSTVEVEDVVDPEDGETSGGN